MKNIRHLSLRRMAVRMIAAQAIQHLVTVSGIITQEKYIDEVEEYLRAERLALSDEQFRQKYSEHLAYTK